MKVMHAISTLSAGGAEVFTAQLCAELMRYAEVHTFVLWGAIDERGHKLFEELRSRGVTLHARRSLKQLKGKLSRLVALPDLCRAIRSVRPDIIHAHEGVPEIFVAICKPFSKRGTRFVRTTHNTHRMSRLPRILWPWIDSRWDATVACGEAVAKKYPFTKGLDRIVTIPNGTRLPGEVVRPDRESLRTALGLPTGKSILLSIGRMFSNNGVLQKGQDVLIDSLSAYGDSRDFVLVLLGDGPARQALRQRADALGVNSRVEFRGSVGNPLDYMFAADLLVMPSRFEGLSIVAIEAACAGIPMLLSRIEEFAMFDCDSTRFCEPGSAESLAATLNEAMGALPALRKHAITNSERYRARFDIRNTATEYARLYERLLAGQRP